MRLSTSLDLVHLISVKENISLLKKAGFDAFDFNMCGNYNGTDKLLVARDDYAQIALDVKKYADELGITCNQSHAPFPVHKDTDDVWNENIHTYLSRAIEITGILGGSVCVVHPWNNWSPQENAERVYLPLKDYAKKYNVKIGVENMWNYSLENGQFKAVEAACSLKDNYLEHLSLLPKEHFVACLDIGHAEMFGDKTSAKELILALNDRLLALHVHDNDKVHDSHTLPYAGSIDWQTVTDALKQIKYCGDFTFETCYFTRNFPKSVWHQALVLGHDVGRYLINQIIN